MKMANIFRVGNSVQCVLGWGMEDSENFFILIFFVAGIVLTLFGIYIFKKFILTERKDGNAK